MANLASDYNFPDVEFVETDTATIVNELTTAYEEQFGRTLYPADPIRQLILWFASILSQERSLLNIAAKRNLPRYAQGGYLDSLAEIFYSIQRQEAESAVTMLRFTLSQEQEEDITIPAGTEAAADGEIRFSTIEELIIPAGELTGETAAECTTPGTVGNGYAVGKIKTLIQQIAYVASVENTTVSIGGTEIETDEEFYGRLRGSYEGYSTTGTAGAYQYHAAQHNAAVADVTVQELEPGQTGITILMDNGIPTNEQIADMQEYLSNDDIRPITDEVFVSAPQPVPFAINLTYYGSPHPEPGGAPLEELVQTAVNEYVTWQTGKLGRRINPARLTAMVVQAGVSSIEINEPVTQRLTSTQCAVLDGDPILIYGGEDE